MNVSEALQAALPAWEAASDDLDAALEERESFGPPVGRFGLAPLDRAWGGIRARELAVIAAGPGVGKTELMLGIVDSWLEAGKRVALIQLEGERHEAHHRLLFRRLSAMLPRRPRGWNFEQWKAGEFPTVRAVEEAAVHELRRDLERLHLMRRSRGKAPIKDPRRLVPLVDGIIGQVDLVVVDHLHALRVPSFKEREEAEWLITALENAVNDAGVPLVGLAQLRKDQRGELPTMQDIKGDGAYGEKPTTVIGLAAPAPGVAESIGFAPDLAPTLVLPWKRRGGLRIRTLCAVAFDPQTCWYQDDYRLGWIGRDKKGPCWVPAQHPPFWAREEQ